MSSLGINPSPSVPDGTDGERTGFLDTARGIGILLVVMGHNDLSLLSPFLFKFIYSFHMPMFFFLSGIFFKSDGPFLSMVRKRFNSVLKPYIVTLLLIFFMSLSFTNVGIGNAISRLFKGLYGSSYYLDWVQLWFLPHLFVTSLIAFAVFKSFKVVKFGLLNWCLMVLSLMSGVFAATQFWPFSLNIGGKQLIVYGLPFNLDLALISLFFFMLGHELLPVLPIEIFRKTWAWVVLVFPLVILVWYFPQAVDLAARRYDSVVINTIEALLGIGFILAFSLQIERLPWLAKFFQLIGRSSLIILIFQVPIQAYWSEKVMLLTAYFPIAYLVGLFGGVFGPLFINDFFIRPNPFLTNLFGQKGANPLSKIQEAKA